MEKAVLDRRLDQMRREGTVFRAGVDVGAELTGDQLLERYDAVVLAVGSTVGRDLPVPGRDLDGIHQAMEYLPQSNRVSLGEEVRRPDHRRPASDVVIIGGGDTGADCLGTAIRQGAASVTQLEILARAAGRPARRPAVAHLPDDLPRLLGPRGGRRPGLRRLDAGVPRRRVGPRAGAAAGRGRRGRSSRSRAPSARSRPGSCCWRWASPARSGPGCSSSSGSTSTSAATSRRDASYASSVDGVFVAGDAGPRSVADRVGDRGGPGGGRGGRRVPHRGDQPAAARSRRPRARWWSERAGSRSGGRQVAPRSSVRRWPLTADLRSVDARVLATGRARAWLRRSPAALGARGLRWRLLVYPSARPAHRRRPAGGRGVPRTAPYVAPQFRHRIPGMPPVIDNDVYSQDPRRDARARRCATTRATSTCPTRTGSTVTVISQRTHRIVRVIPTGYLSQHVVPSYDLRTLYTNSSDANELVEIDPRTGRADAHDPDAAALQPLLHPRRAGRRW